MRPLQRKEKPDFQRFLKVLRRQGDRSYVPFFEMVIDEMHFSAVTGIEPPPGLNFMPTSPTFTETFAFYLRCCAAMGFDHGIINICGFAGFPTSRHGVEGTRRNFIMADDGVISSEADFDRYPWPSTSGIDAEAMAATARLAPEGMGVMTGTGAPFSILFDLFGFTGLSMLLYENRELVRRVAEKVGSTMLEVFRTCAQMPFIDGIMVSGDMGFKTGTMISPSDLREFVLPWHRRICDAVHAEGKIVLLHSCGNLKEIMPDIIECGYDGKHSFEDAITPGFGDQFRQYGRDICLLGGVDVDFLCRSSEEEIRRRVREMIDTYGPDGGYVLGSGNSIPEYLPSENYWAMLDEGLKYGRP